MTCGCKLLNTISTLHSRFSNCLFAVLQGKKEVILIQLYNYREKKAWLNELLMNQKNEWHSEQ